MEDHIMGDAGLPIPSDVLDHVSIAVPDLEAAADFYRNIFGLTVGDAIDLPGEAMRIAYVQLANIKIELMQPTGENAAIAKFLARNPTGGIHHICMATPDADAAANAASKAGLRVLGDGAPRPGHHGRKLFFLHPKDAIGTLIEVEEAE
jgi:methylmalonyl-CoA/ethylmalonyl-CoA epimerase